MILTDGFPFVLLGMNVRILPCRSGWAVCSEKGRPIAFFMVAQTPGQAIARAMGAIEYTRTIWMRPKGIGLDYSEAK